MELKKKKPQLRFQSQEQLDMAYKLAFENSLELAASFIITEYQLSSQKKARKIIDEQVIPMIKEQLLKCNKEFRNAAKRSGLTFVPDLDDVRIRRITRVQLELHFQEIPGQKQLPFK